jgi:hypothetical protein
LIIEEANVTSKKINDGMLLPFNDHLKVSRLIPLLTGTIKDDSNVFFSILPYLTERDSDRLAVV